MLNIILCGVGGQGTVLASKIIAKATLAEGKKVVSSETIGMAQRGGSVTSHLKIYEDDGVHAPLVKLGDADIIIAFELAEAVRVFPYLKKGGAMVVSTGTIKPITKYDYDKEKLINFLQENVKNLKLVDGFKVCEEIGSYRALNIVLLGSSEELLKLEKLEETIEKSVKPQFVELNKKAFAGGKSL